MKQQQRIPQGSIRTRPTPHPRQLHEEAFDLYCAGLSCSQVGVALRERCGADTPHYSTLRRWMLRDRWPSRRLSIHEHASRLEDQVRAAEDNRLIASLTGLRDTLVAAGSALPFRSAEGAVFSLAAVQKVIDRLSRAPVEESDVFSQENLDLVIDTILQVLQEDEVVGAALEQRMPQILDIIESSLDDLEVKERDGP